MAKLLLVVIVSIIVAGCGGGSHQGIPSIPIGDLQAAPEQVEIAGTQYIIGQGSYLTRDFMPVYTWPDGGPLVASAHITDTAFNPLPSNIEARYVYVINGTEIWQSELSSLGVSTSDGPKWETGTLVDMVVMLYHGSESYLVKASNMEIQRLD